MTTKLIARLAPLIALMAVVIEAWVPHPLGTQRYQRPCHLQAAKRGKGLKEIAKSGGPKSPSPGGGIQGNKRVGGSVKADPKARELSAVKAAQVLKLVEEAADPESKTTIDVRAIEQLVKEAAALNQDTTGEGTGSGAAGGAQPSRSPLMLGDWQLAWCSSDDALCAVGSGLHKLPLTVMEDLFLSLRAPAQGKKSSPTPLGKPFDTVECAEILRVIGPFPNVRNTLAGQWSFPAYGYWAEADETTGSGLEFTYDTMIDGNGGTIKAPDGSDRRKVNFDVNCVGETGIVFTQKEKATLSSASSTPLILVFKRVDDLEEEFKRLRVDRPDDWDEPKENTGPSISLPKMPWSKADDNSD